ncbi:hypothetical protein ACHAWX_000286 [Stephanocyclus meneghinianus]
MSLPVSVAKCGMNAEKEDTASKSSNTDDVAKNWNKDDTSMEKIEVFLSHKATRSNSGEGKGLQK